MQVMKFGGTSVANADNMLKVTEIVAKAAERDRTILVVSAIKRLHRHSDKNRHTCGRAGRKLQNLIDQPAAEASRNNRQPAPT